jgi:hypothetical protein
LSASGIGFVALILGYFGAEGLVASISWIAPATVLVSLAAFFGLTQDWRTVIGLGFSLAVTTLMGLWGRSLQGGKSSFDIVGFYEALAIVAALMTVVAARQPRLEDTSGLARTVEERAPAVLCIAAATLLALLLTGHLDPAVATVLCAGTLCSLLLVTAVTSALRTLLPRRRSVAELYGRRA